MHAMQHLLGIYVQQIRHALCGLLFRSDPDWRAVVVVVIQRVHSHALHVDLYCVGRRGAQ